MTDDDKPHEYIPHEWRDIAVGTGFIGYDDILAERNNLAEAVREVNARLVEVTAERDAARQSRKRLVQLVNYWHAEADEWQESYQFAGTVIARVRDSRDSLSAIVEKGEAERDTDCRIVINPEVLDGRPYIRGTRIPVHVIVDGLADGMTPQELMEHFERLTIADIQSVQA